VRNELPVLVTAVTGITIPVAVFLGVAKGFTQAIDRWYVVSLGFAVLTGVVNLSLIHTRNVSRRGRDWHHSVALLVSMYGLLVLGLVQKTTGKVYSFVFQAAIVPLGASMFAILAFYIASAAYRAFRTRNVEATVLLVTALVVMLGRAPIGAAISSFLPAITGWIMDVPNTAAMRGIGLGVYLGMFAMAIRVILGLEKTHLGG
jgi:lysylphosphatidylglycerol synthetase-like protein (DUF2156 family)